MIKVCGMLIFFSAATAYGFYKAVSLQKRILLLEKIYSSLSKLKEHIKYGNSEINTLIKKCFADCKAIEIQGNRVKVNSNLLLKEDLDLMQEIFSHLGEGYGENECKKIELYLSLLGSRINEVREETAGKAKIWKTGGISIGLAVCILLF